MSASMAGPGTAAASGAGATFAVPQAAVVQFDRRTSAGGALVRVQASDLYDSCGRLQASGVTMTNCSCRRAYSGLTVVFDAAFLEGTRAIAGVAIDGNIFAAVGDPAAANMSGIIVRDSDTGVEQSSNTVLPA